ncbi:MAG TPA: SRPBCC domain-containing protein [Thermoanaerobaculia bacterium]|nr:SRPBCC domain-containing protein [Thermoanaerobaculia bacterium]
MKKIEKEVIIKATPEEVWRALTAAEELKRWFPLDARVTPGPGGAIMFSFGEGMEWESPIDVWEPNRHLRTVSEYGAQKMAVDYYLEGRGGETVLRFVHSGFADDAWDDELDTMSAGWATFLANLRHYLERHPGQPRTVAYYRHPVVELDRETAFARVLEAMNIRRDGNRYTSDWGSGDILVDRPPINFTGTVEKWDDASLMIEIEPGRGRCRPAIWVSLYGEEQSKAPELQERVKGLLEKAFAT